MTAAEHLAQAEGYLQTAGTLSDQGLHDMAALNIQAAIANAIMALAVEAGVPHLGQGGGGGTDGQSADRADT